MNIKEFTTRLNWQIDHAKDCQNTDGRLPGFIQGLEFAAKLAQKIIIVPSIEELTMLVHDNAKAHGWWDDGERNVGELLMLCVSELSEAFEEYRNGRQMTETYYSKDKQGNDKMEGVPSELADTVIRIMDLCGHYGIDLEKTILEKHEYNKSRPFKHGGKKC